MPETIALFSNNIFYAMGLQNLIPDYKLQNTNLQDLQEKELQEILADVELVLVESACILPEETVSLVKSLLEMQIQVIYLAQNRDKLIPRLCSLGCQGIIEQEQVNEQLSVAIKAITSGGTYYSQGVLADSYMVLLGPLVELFEELDATTQKLTPKEKEIFELYVTGLSLTNIMDELEISKSTINTHMESVRAKFGVSSNREIITKYQINRLKSNF